jgi:hypothetical protein
MKKNELDRLRLIISEIENLAIRTNNRRILNILKRERGELKKTIPDELLDSRGYPTLEWLQFLENYEPCEELPLMTVIRDILPKGWYMAEWGYVLRKKYRGVIKLELHTGGWSGNEEIISAILSNMNFTHFKMQYVGWRAGGHYYFEIKC